MVDLPSSMPMYEQMASANGLFEVPLKTFTMYLFRYSGQKPAELMEKKAGRTLAAKHPGASGISNPDVFRALVGSFNAEAQPNGVQSLNR